jgi:hypothetical protein
MKPKFKIGDIVTINFIKGSTCDDYPLSFVDSMRKYHGRKYKILKILKATPSNRKYACYYDGYEYHLDEQGYWSWSSSMFLEAQEI